VNTVWVKSAPGCTKLASGRRTTEPAKRLPEFFFFVTAIGSADWSRGRLNSQQRQFPSVGQSGRLGLPATRARLLGIRQQSRSMQSGAERFY